jgi:hypothetical protein
MPRRVDVGELRRDTYCDTIWCRNKFGVIFFDVYVNRKKTELMFDTGADLLVLKRDSLSTKKYASIRITDSNNHEEYEAVEQIKKIKIRHQKYKEFFAVRSYFPTLFACMSDGLLGANMIKRSNWKITDTFLAFSDKPFKAEGEVKQVDYFLYASNRFFSNFTVNGMKIDTCLIDYGGRFEMELPLKYCDEFKKHIKVLNRITKSVASQWGIHGKSEPDTTVVINCSIDFNGISMDSVNVRFARKTKERSIGVLLLSRFHAVYIDKSKGRLMYELPVSPNRWQRKCPFSVSLQGSSFVVDGIEIRDKTSLPLRMGDQLKEINGKKPADFHSPCEFIFWLQELKRVKQVEVITADNQKILIKS